MNWDQIEGSWKQVKGKAKEQWGRLTDDELDQAAGRREQLIGKVQDVTGTPEIVRSAKLMRRCVAGSVSDGHYGSVTLWRRGWASTSGPFSVRAPGTDVARLK
jgi:uncharacterized protein YjbJ (UPF0337 family)